MPLVLCSLVYSFRIPDRPRISVMCIWSCLYSHTFIFPVLLTPSFLLSLSFILSLRASFCLLPFPIFVSISSSFPPASSFSLLHFLFDSNAPVKNCVVACRSTKLALVILVSVNLLSYQLPKPTRDSWGRENLGCISNSPCISFVNTSVISPLFYCTDMSVYRRKSGTLKAFQNSSSPSLLHGKLFSRSYVLCKMRHT